MDMEVKYIGNIFSEETIVIKLEDSSSLFIPPSSSRYNGLYQDYSFEYKIEIKSYIETLIKAINRYKDTLISSKPNQLYTVYYVLGYLDCLVSQLIC